MVDNFTQLDMTGVEAKGDAASGAFFSEDGIYDGVCTDIEFKTTKKGDGKLVVVDLCDAAGRSITHRFNVSNKSEVAQRIGRAQFKFFLTVGGHPNPDKPTDVKSVIGLPCRFEIRMGEPQTKNDGSGATIRFPEIIGFKELSTNRVDLATAQAAQSTAKKAAAAKDAPPATKPGGTTDDDIPF